MTVRKPFILLWLEDQIEQIEKPVNELTKRLRAARKTPIRLIKAQSLEEARKILCNKKRLIPDLLILDIILPRDEIARQAVPPRVDMNAGYLLWHMMRKQKPWSDRLSAIPICVVSARARPVFRSQMEADDNLVWCEKPIPPRDILSAIMSLLDENVSRTTT